ncbi:hypothetical protein ACL1EX_04625 [Corynebacterium striatum]
MAEVDKELAALWFKHECTLLRGAGASPYGWQDGTPVPFKAFVRQATRRTVDAAGEHTVTDTIVYCPLGLVVERGDFIELPDPFEAGPWEVTTRSAHDGAGNQTPDHQKLIMTIPDSGGDGGAQPNDSGVINPYG